MKYGKFENGKLTIARNFIKTNGITIINPTNEQYILHGYKPIVYTDMPESDEYYYTSIFSDKGDKIVQVWEQAGRIENQEIM